MWTCRKCNAEVEDNFEVCSSCGTAVDGSPDQFKGEPWRAPVPHDLSPIEGLHFLEGQLSALMDSKDTPDWKVNPAFHPDVLAWIQRHANNTGFVQKAQKLQQNRAKYFATIRTQQLQPKPAVEEQKPGEKETSRPGVGGGGTGAATKWLIVKPLRFLWRLFKVTFILLLVVGLFGFLAALLYRGYGDKQLQEAIYETDVKEDGSHWTWEGLQEKRKKIDDKDNAALVVEAVAKKLPGNQFNHPMIGKLIHEFRMKPIREFRFINIEGPLKAEQADELRRELEKHQDALQQARGLAKLSVGRWPDKAMSEADSDQGPSPDGCVPIVAVYLLLDACLLSHEQRPGEALATTRALLVAGRSVGDDYIPDRQLCRKFAGNFAGHGIGRILAICPTANDADLSLTQQLIEDEAKQPLLLWALRGQRARYEEDWRAPETGDHQTLGELVPDPAAFTLFTKDTPLASVEVFLRGGQLTLAKAQYLRELTEAVEIAHLPVEQQVGKFATYQGAPLVLSLVAHYHEYTAWLRCTAATLAAERHRLAASKWLDSWEELVPKYLAAVPIDPFDGKPLRLKKNADGITIYSIGPDGKDDDGHVIFDPPVHPRDIGFHLLDPQHRGQPVRPKE